MHSNVKIWLSVLIQRQCLMQDEIFSIMSVTHRPLSALAKCAMAPAKWTFAFLAAALLTCLPSDAMAKRASIALTFDDLPALTIFKDQAYVNDLTVRLLSSLKRHRIPAIGFVNESKLEDLDRSQQIRVLQQWLAASMRLGNHTFSHESPNSLGAEGFIADIVRGEPVTRALLAARHQRLDWFRHPYLETGAPETVKRAIDTWLRLHHYRIAPVTIDANDWEFAEPYDDAVARGNQADTKHIRASYLEYT